MSEYTPTTEEIERGYAHSLPGGFSARVLARRYFDRWLAAEDRKAKAGALREAAKALKVNTWMDLLEGPLPQKIGNSQRLVDWMRDRADRIEGDDT